MTIINSSSWASITTIIRASTGDRRERAWGRGREMGHWRAPTEHPRREAIELRNACEPMHEIGAARSVSHRIVSKRAAGPLDAFGAKA
jgi:hypothetical protein